ncbi:tripartite tricarboxylate transporter substrate binding protein [Parapusillimonas sp. SGNA-6]|nr:tripartite tricarboxylate transporter substrate binding protein [Parapusillimonas sp. SGNA-6]
MIKSLSLRSAAAAVTATFLMAATGAAHAADTWPQKPVRWIIGFAAGGSADTLTRIAADQLAEKLGQSVVVENRPGASGAIALQHVTQTSPDDTVLITVPGPIIFPNPQPEIGKELAPIMLLAEGPMIVVGPAANKQDSLAEVIEDAKARPQAWSYATSGTGTSQHLAGELINHLAGTHLLQVPYKGGGQAVTDVVGAQLPLAILGPTPVLPHIRSGKLKAYAVTTTYRLKSLPDVPTMQEAGIPGYDATQWFAAATVKGVDPQRIQTLNRLLADIVTTPKFQEAVNAAGMVAGKGSPEDLQQFVARDSEKWAEVVRSTGMSVGR